MKIENGSRPTVPFDQTIVGRCYMQVGYESERERVLLKTDEGPLVALRTGVILLKPISTARFYEVNAKVVVEG